MQLLKALLQKDPNKRPSSTTWKSSGNGCRMLDMVGGALDFETAIVRNLSMFFINLFLPSWGESLIIHVSYLLSNTWCPSQTIILSSTVHLPVSDISQEFSPWSDLCHLSQVPRRVSSPSGPWRSRTCGTAPPPRRRTKPWRTAPSARRHGPRRSPRPARPRCRRWCGPPHAMTLRNRRHHSGCFLWVFCVNRCQSVEVLGYTSQNMGKSNG